MTTGADVDSNADGGADSEAGEAGEVGGVGGVNDEVSPDVAPHDLAFDELFAAEHSRMMRLAFLLTGSVSQAEDAVQDAFAQVFERWNAVHAPAPFLRTCVVNHCRSWHRRRGVADRKQHLVIERAEHRDRPNEMADALARLPSRRRAAVVLRFYEQLTIAEIATALGISEGSVKSSLHRGLDQLKGMLS